MLKARHYKALKEIKVMATDNELISILSNLDSEMERRSFFNFSNHLNPCVTQPSKHSDSWDSFDEGGFSRLFPPFYYDGGVL